MQKQVTVLVIASDCVLVFLLTARFAFTDDQLNNLFVEIFCILDEIKPMFALC